MLIEIEGLSYFLPNDFRDITLEEYVSINSYIEKNKITEEATDDEKLQFYIGYLMQFGLPKHSLNKVKLYTDKDDELGIVNLFNYLFQFSQMPTSEQVHDFQKFVHNGKWYGFNSNSLSLTGGERPMTDYTFEEYEEANSIMQSMSQVGKGDLSQLSLLCAVFYRPLVWKRFKKIIEPYDASKVFDRANEFNTLPMDKVFKAYFFLLSQIRGYNVDMANSLIKEVQNNLN